MRYSIKVICMFLLITGMVSAIDHYVTWYEDDTTQGTIQDAVDDCSDGDTVIVAEGFYTGPGNYNIDMYGKAIIIRSEDPDDPVVVAATVINCSNNRGFVFKSGENNDSQISGLTITGGNSYLGGAIECTNSSPVISKCVITDNTGSLGGAIFSGSGSNPVITNCTITNNSSGIYGGGIYCQGGNITINNCVIASNTSSISGGAIGCNRQSSITINGSTIRGNIAGNGPFDCAGGIYCANSAELSVKNSILWGNTATFGDQIYAGTDCKVDISYCDVQDGQDEIYTNSTDILNWGSGNIDTDPIFVGDNDCHLADDSNCIDAGDAEYKAAKRETDIDGQKRISGQTIDMGADEAKAALRARIRFTPGAINLKGRATQINCKITLEEGYNADDIEIDTIMINGTAKTLASHLCQEGKTLMVRLFLVTDDITGDISADNTIELTVTGSFSDDEETTFVGSDTVNVLTHSGKQMTKARGK